MRISHEVYLRACPDGAESSAVLRLESGLPGLARSRFQRDRDGSSCNPLFRFSRQRRLPGGHEYDRFAFRTARDERRRGKALGGNRLVALVKDVDGNRIACGHELGMDTGYILHLTAVCPFGAVDVLRGGRTRQRYRGDKGEYVFHHVSR